MGFKASFIFTGPLTVLIGLGAILETIGQGPGGIMLYSGIGLTFLYILALILS